MKQERPLLILLMALNAALVGACALFVIHSHGSRGVDQIASPALAQTRPALSLQPTARAASPVPATPSPSSSRPVDWRDVWSAAYPPYLQKLRDAGCPENRLAELVARDIEEFQAQQCLEAAMAHDHEWWRADCPESTADALRMLGQAMAQQRTDLLNKLLGSNPAHSRGVKFWRVAPLTGSALGRLDPEVHEQAQRICERALDLSSLSRGEAAKSREELREEMAALLPPDALEAFLLRYSDEAKRLRVELGPIAPSPEEFRKIFAAIDPLDRRMELEYGGVSALSGAQFDQHQKIRGAAMRGCLSPAKLKDLAYSGAVRLSERHVERRE